MPKTGTAYNDHLSINCPSSLREALLAISILEGDVGEYNRVARNLLTRAVEDRLADMDSKERKKYEDVLLAVQAETIVSRQSKLDREKAKLRKEYQGG